MTQEQIENEEIVSEKSESGENSDDMYDPIFNEKDGNDTHTTK